MILTLEEKDTLSVSPFSPSQNCKHSRVNKLCVKEIKQNRSASLSTSLTGCLRGQPWSLRDLDRFDRYSFDAHSWRDNWWVHSNISGIFEQFSIWLCVKNMKTQETFKKKSGHTPVLCVRKYFLISAFWKLTNMYLNGYEKGWPLFCPFKPNWWVHSNISGIFEQFSIRLCVKKWRRNVIDRQQYTQRYLQTFV